jgi:PAS domain S-box-containing protein
MGRCGRTLEAVDATKVEDLTRSEERLQAVIESSPLGIMEVDLDTRIVRWNTAAERIFGWTREEMLGRADMPMVQASRKDEGARLRATLRAGEAFSGYETIRQRKDGSLIDVSIAAAPVRDSSGEVTGFMVVYSDITERKLQETRLAEAQQLAHIGSWEWEVVSNRITWSDELYRLWGLEPGSKEMFYEEFLASVHPEDREMVKETVDRAYEERTPFAFEHRVPLPDGTVRWVSSRGVVDTDDSGRPIRTRGTAQDITERKLYEAELHRLNDELHARLDDLAASRARIVAAGDVERRRLERNLHDGAQQRIVTLSVSLRLALDKLDDDPGTARELLGAASEEVALVLEELRELARGLHPALLTEHGLGPAVDSLAQRVPVQVEIVETPAGRLPETIEAAAYYLIAEALTNVAKHAQAMAARVSVLQRDSTVVVEVSDDGVGGADADAGSGLCGLMDRVEALGGRLELVSPAGVGTTLRAEIPVSRSLDEGNVYGGPAVGEPSARG